MSCLQDENLPELRSQLYGSERHCFATPSQTMPIVLHPAWCHRCAVGPCGTWCPEELPNESLLSISQPKWLQLPQWHRCDILGLFVTEIQIRHILQSKHRTARNNESSYLSEVNFASNCTTTPTDRVTSPLCSNGKVLPWSVFQLVHNYMMHRRPLASSCKTRENKERSH